MTSAASQRLRELAGVANLLADTIDADDKARLPVLPICRAVVLADRTATELAGYFSTLAGENPLL